MQTQSSPVRAESTRRVALASMVGTSIEWYDFFIFGTASALVFGQLFFPTFSELAGTLAAISMGAVYMVALVVCGLGLYFGLLPGEGPFAITVVPAIFALVAIAAGLGLSRVPPDLQGRLEGFARRGGQDDPVRQQLRPEVDHRQRAERREEAGGHDPRGPESEPHEREHRADAGRDRRGCAQ